MSETRLTLQEAVERYGNEKQKQMIVKMNGNLKADSFNSLLKTIEQHFHSVTVEGRGSKRVFICKGEYDEIQERKTNYSNCGKHNELPYKQSLSMLILHYIIKNKPQEQMSLNQWLINIGAVDSRLIYVNGSGVYNHQGSKVADFKQLVEKKILNNDNFDMLEHYTNYEISYLKQGLKSAFAELKKKKIIHHTVGRMGCYTVSEYVDGECIEIKKYRQLAEGEIYQLGQIEARLQSKHGLTQSLIYLQPNNEKVKAYKEELEAELYHNFGVEYTFESHGAYLRTNNKTVVEYLEEKYRKEFKKIYQEYSLSMAQKRQDKFDKKKSYNPLDSVSLLKDIGIYVKVWEELQEYYNIKVK